MAPSDDDAANDDAADVAIVEGGAKSTMVGAHAPQPHDAAATDGAPGALVPPPHEPGVLPGWLHHLGADVIIAGGMGQRAISLFGE